MNKIIITLFSVALLLGSCEWLEDNAPAGLSNDEIIEGLKTALVVGTDSSSTALSLANGYYGDALVKIPLPDEAIKVQNEINAILSLAPSLKSYLNLDKQFENVVMSVNRAAEDAAKESAPIFKEAITGLSISEGLEILNGQVPAGSGTKSGDFDSTAATQFLKGETFSPLTGVFAPKIDVSLSKDLGLGFSANDAWTALRTAYNSSVSTIKGNIVTNIALQATGHSLEPLETETIGIFATEKALDGLFFKVGETEKKIRRNPLEWAIDILHRVFGKK